MFSYAHNSCYRNHQRYTLCGIHFSEQHSSQWQTCKQCREFVAKTEMYVYYGTNDYNFEKLKDPPSFEPTKCSGCNAVIALADGGYSVRGTDYRCQKCSASEFSGFNL